MGALITRILVLLGFSQETASKIGELAILVAILGVVMTIMRFLKRMITYPLFLGAIVGALTLFPETIGWIFLKIGEIELQVMTILMTAIMPDIVSVGGGEYQTWSQVWQDGLNILPSEIVDVMNSVGVAYLLGMVTSTISAVGMIRLYRRVMLRAGLL